MTNNAMSRDAYKSVKRMDRIQMSAYFIRVYQRGYKAALKDTDEKLNGIIANRIADGLAAIEPDESTYLNAGEE